MYLVQTCIGDTFEHHQFRNIREVIEFIRKNKIESFRYRIFKEVTP